MVLLHPGFTEYKIMVDGACRLTSVTGWAGAYFGLFGTNLHSIDFLSSDWDPLIGLIPVPDREELYTLFWTTFAQAANRNITNVILRAIKTARTIGLLLAYGNPLRPTNNLGSMPMSDKEYRLVDTALLEALLILPNTKLD